MSRRPMLAAPLAACLMACGLVSRDEVARVPSPDGRVEAVLIETNGGATTSFGYEVLVTEKGNTRGNQVASLYGAVRSQRAYGVNLKWASNTQLLVEYQTARRETLDRAIVHVAGRDIRTAFKPGLSDPTAPAGGMLYNLKRQR